MKADRKKIKLVMMRKHMTVQDLAKAAQMPPQTAAAIICGMNVQPDTMIQIAQALGVSLLDIASGVAAAPHQGEPPMLPAGQVRIDLERFADALARSGMSFKALAERAGVSVGVIRHIGRGAEAHRADTVDKLADALGVAACNIIQEE